MVVNILDLGSSTLSPHNTFCIFACINNCVSFFICFTSLYQILNGLVKTSITLLDALDRSSQLNGN
ncbi:MAG: hypothetical protein WCG25_06120 [bacterium]